MSWVMATYRKYMGNASGAHRRIDTLNDPSPTCFSSAGAQEFREVENRSTGERRVRKRSGPHPHMRMASRDLENPKDPIESSDELQQDEYPPTRGVNSTFINKTRHTDGADTRFYASYSQPKGSKRKSPPSDDELGAESRKPKPPARPAKRTLANQTTKFASSSVSQRGAIAPTVWSNSPPKPFLVRVRDAVCLQHYRLKKSHPAYSSQGECFLRPVQDGKELRAFRDDSQEMREVSCWLKIGKKINKVAFNDSSDFILIHQANEDNPQIGHLMVLQFFSKDDASMVKEWMKRNLSPGVKFHEEDCQKLQGIFNKAKRDVEDNILKRPSSTHNQDLQVVDHPTESQRPSLATPRPDKTSPGESQNKDRPLIRDRMKVSSPNTQEQKTPGSSDRPRSQSSALWTLSTFKAADDEQLPSQDSPRRSSPNLKTYGSQTRVLRSRPATDPEMVEDEPERTPRWSDTHPDWSKTWKMPLTLRRTTVDVQDIPRLDEGEFLNDNLLNFGLQWLFDNAGKSNPNLLKRVYMFNTFFYTKLKSLKGKQINYDGVKSWTSRVDLFSYDYIVVPVNERFHWWLAIICNARQLDPSSHNAPPDDGSSGAEDKNWDQDEPTKSPQDTTAAGLSQLSISEPRENATGKPAGDDHPDKMVVELDGEDVTMKDAPTPDTTKQNGATKSPFPKGCSPTDFKIITLDSLEIPHTPAVTALKTYLIEELKAKKKMEARELPGPVAMRAVKIPAQGNHSDCGVYVLGYMQQFVKDPDTFVHTLLRKEKPDWTIDASKQRVEWRDTILIEQKRHQLEVEKLKEEEKKAKGAKITPPTPAGKKATQPGSVNPKARSSPALKETASQPKVTPPAVHSPRPSKEASPASKPQATSNPPAQSGEKKQQVTIVDLSSPVAKEKTTPRPEPVNVAAVSPSRPRTADSPSRQLREFQAITPSKGAKASQPTTPGTLGRNMPSTGASTKTAKDDSFQEVSPTNFYRNSNARPSSHPPSSPPKPSGRTQRNHLSSSPPQSKSKGMVGWATLQTGASPNPPRPPPRPSQPNPASGSLFYTSSSFALPKDDNDGPARPNITKSPRPTTGNRSTIDLTDDSMEIVEVREGPGAI